MERKRLATLGLGGLFGLGIMVQFVPVNRTNPEVTREVRWDSEATRTLAQRSCYDCHSNQTQWPWYSYVAPMSWLVAKDVAEGREHLNFSSWDQPNEDAEEIIEMVEEREMPLKKYIALHPGARMDETTLAAFVRGLEATLMADPPVPSEGDDDEEHEG